MEKRELKTVISLLPLLLLMISLIVLIFIRTIWSLSICLVLNTFLIMLNGYLRGRLKARFDCFFGAIWILLTVLDFLLFIGAISKPLAALTASYLLKV